MGSHGVKPSDADFDVAIVGASLAGCTAAILLARAGLRVALAERRTEMAAYKRICGHYIQPTAIPTIERLGLMQPILDAGAVRSRLGVCFDGAYIDAGALSRVPPGVNIRRQLLDPLIRQIAAETPNVELMMGLTAHELLRERGRICGVVLRDRNRAQTRLRAPLLVGADGRSSTIAKLSGLPVRESPNGRFSYAGYFEGPAPARFPNAVVWSVDGLDWAGAMPTDGQLTLYLCMPAKERLAEFRADPAGALRAHIESLPVAPPIAASLLVGDVIGKLHIPNVSRRATAPGLALVGDAALAIDPLGAVGCGWAMQSAEWLADSVSPALAADESLARGLARYRRRRARALRGHALVLQRNSRARPFDARARLIVSAAVEDRQIAATLEQLLTCSIGPGRYLARTLTRAIALRVRGRRAPSQIAVRSGAGSPEEASPDAGV